VYSLRLGKFHAAAFPGASNAWATARRARNGCIFADETVRSWEVAAQSLLIFAYFY
jgi:hypothetical protein